MSKFLKIGLSVSAVLVAIAIYVVFFATYSTGYRVGTIIKMTKRGVVFKTYEGQLHTGGISADVGDAGATSMWDFTVRRGEEDIRKEIEKAVDSGSRVKLYYNEKFYQWAFFGDTKYFVNKVETVGNKADSATEE